MRSRSVASSRATPARAQTWKADNGNGTFSNPLLPGRYFLHCWVTRCRVQGDLALHALPLLDFVVYGTQPGLGIVSVDADVRGALQPGGPA